MHIGVDIGGTFTDLVVSENGQLRIHKLLSTPGEPARAMLDGLAALSGNLQRITQVTHGSTVATNAILERKGARCALITTQGFRDVLFIGRQNRPELYALHPQLPPPLIPREHCYEVPERLDYTGAVLTPLDSAALDRVLDDIERAGIESVAVCFLYSFVNPAHERMVRDRIRERGFLSEEQITLSSDVLPEFREYERASTVALEAYVRPVISRYLSMLEASLPSQAGLRVMKSDGGIVSAAGARERAVLMALSGPAAGVIGAFHLAQQAGFDHIITLDMGGTSTDVALCPGAPVRRGETEIDGLPLRTRILDIETVGAGGGSIARLDAGGGLRVGPESAGANPGPVAYGRGGTQPTVTDANVVLGRLDAAHFLGGTMALATDAAEHALERLGSAMGKSAGEAAQGVVRIANANIERAIRRVSVERGYDPRDFTLVAFGGAGPLHACEVAEGLQIPRVLVPRTPGVLCALGLLVADVQLDFSQSLLNQPVAAFAPALDRLRAKARAALEHEGVAEADYVLTPALDARYRGQAYELLIPYADDPAAIAESFHAAHTAAYGHAFPERPVEVVTLRLQATAIVDKPKLEPRPVRTNDGAEAVVGSAENLLVDGKRVTWYDRAALMPGAAFSGPAVLFQMDCTTYVPPNWQARVDALENLILTYTLAAPDGADTR